MQNKDNNDSGMPEKRGVQGIVPLLVVFLLGSFMFNYISASFTSGGQATVSYSQFLSLVESGNISHVEMDDTQIYAKLTDNYESAEVSEILGLEGAQDLSVLQTGKVDDPNLVGTLQQYNVDINQVVAGNTSIFTSILSSILPFIIIVAIYFFAMRWFMKRMGGSGDGENSGVGGLMGGMMGNAGKSKAKVYNVEQNTGITFKDVAGQDEAKESLVELVDYLNNPEKFSKIGAKQPKGALLVGPPGTGKTLLAKAVAGEAGVPFYHLTGSEFVEMFVGVGAARVRDLFQTAAKNAPCIIFIDEIDAIGKKRDNQIGGNDEREQTLNQLLAEMDGFESGKGILVLAATNRPEILDKALLRPGRFDRRIIVEKPDIAGRESILGVHASKVALGDNVDLHTVALATSGATGADLANMVNEAALRAVKMGRQFVLQEDLMESVEVVIAGKEKKDRLLSPKERQLVAYHEVGHALVSALQKNAQPVQKITIVPRTMGALGYTMSVPEEERYLYTKEELLDQITMLLGGRAAELIKFGAATTGASNDIERATKMARSMITQYGMSEKFGPMSIEVIDDQYLSQRSISNCSDQTNGSVDLEVRNILESCQQSAIDLLAENMDALDRISEHLGEHENITGEQFMLLLSQVKGERGEKDISVA